MDYEWQLEVKGIPAKAVKGGPANASKGGPGSGHHGHAGRLGKVGGSAPGKGGGFSISVQDGEVTVDHDTASVRAAQAAKSGESFDATLYRGTGTDPEEAKRNRIRSQFAVGRYWSPFPEVAVTYGPDVRSETVSLKKPYVYDLPGKKPYFQELQAEFGTRKPEEITRKLASQGYDGLIVRGVPVNRFTPEGDAVAFRDSIEVILFSGTGKSHDYQWQIEVVPPRQTSKGGPGSGHHGHAGRPGKRGGSLPGKGGGGGAETGRYQAGDDLEGSPFGSWAASMDDQLKGYRGVNPSGIGFGSTEGKGVYLSKDKELAKFFAGDQGTVRRYKFREPKKPLVVDEEPLYLLSEADELEDPPNKGDSPWLAANKRAVKRAYEKTGGKWDTDLAAKYLTEDLKGQGYDAVFVRSDGEEWVVLFDPKAVTGRTI